MGSGGKGHKFWCDKCQCYVDFSDFETCESICEYCEVRENNKARAEAAEAEVERLRAELAAMPRPEDRCHGEWPCEASTALAFTEAEMARAEARAEAAEQRAEAAEAEAERLRSAIAETLRLADIYAGVAAHNAEAEPETAGEAWRSPYMATMRELRRALGGE